MNRKCLLVVAFALACGGESHFDRKEVTLPQIRNMCDEWAQWQQGCGRDPGDFAEQCAADPRWAYMWDDAVQTLEECFLTLDCAESDDTCVERLVEDLDVDPSDDALFTDCVERAAMCPEVLDDDCTPVLWYHDGSRDRVRDCLALSCAELDACLQDPVPE